ncbi:MAG: ATP-binding cassette domain-containing protein [Planctomycetota bacterium]|nr:ATP-binding cassette domain-containing protein [Planctomycetota bacterium]
MFPTVEVQDLTAQYGDFVVLNGINMSVEKGEILTILGPSGCGKTTLLKHLIGLLRPTRGKVFINGVDLAELDEVQMEELRQDIGVLFQGGALFGSMTVEENVAMPLVEHLGMDLKLAKRIAQIKLSLVQMQHAAEQFPAELSGGMRKRAALARAIALDPSVLFCDEPSAGLDPITSLELDKLLLNLNDLLGMTIVVVTHELQSIFTIAQRAVMLDRGRVLAEGTLDELLASNNERVVNFLKRKGFEPIGMNESWVDAALVKN